MRYITLTPSCPCIPTVEKVDLESIQCKFESYQGHSTIILNYSMIVSLKTIPYKMKLTKTQKIIGGVATAVVVLGGGFFVKVRHDEATKKEVERIAYENRAIVDESCVMNGYGQGSCSFTNTGKTAGAVCGVIQVNGPGTISSDTFCSGSVEPQSTEKVEFSIPQVDVLCDNGFASWTEKCTFDFVTDEPAAKPGPVT